MIERKDSLKNMLKILKLFWSSNYSLNTLYFFLTIIQGFVPPTILYFLKKIVDVIENKDFPPENFMKSTIPDYLIICLIAALSFTFIKILLEYLAEKQTYFLIKKIVPKIQQKSSEIDYEYYENSKFNDILYKSQEESLYRPRKILNELFSLIQSLITFSAIGILIFNFNYKIGLILLLAMIPSTLVRLKFSEKIFLLEKSQTERVRRGIYYNTIVTSPEFAKENRLFGALDFFKNSYLENLETVYNKKIQIFKKRSTIEFFSRIMVDICFNISLIFLIVSVVTGEQKISNLLLFYQGFQMGINNLQTIFNSFAGLYEDGLYVASFFQFLAIEPKIEIKSSQAAKKEYILGDICLKNVNFYYPNNPENIILKNINLKIPAGKKIALVGENGAGKTTLVKLINRLYDPSSGIISWKEMNIKNYNIRYLRNNITSIMQDFGKYELTIKENILFGAAEDARALEYACVSAGLLNLIKTLPQGLNTKLGKTFSDGIELSIGQWQKIALARALYRNAPLIILDEPTSSLDAHSEREFYNNLIATIKDKTLILVTHRLSAIKLADYVYFLENGAILEEGTHKDLISLKKKYFYLYNLQAKSFEIDL
jgi:ATP-binding cassette subfamily B protein